MPKKMASLTTDAKLCIERVVEVSTRTPAANLDFTKDYNILETCKWILDNDYKKVCLQFPDELLEVSSRIYKEINLRVNADLYILGDTSYSSCCVDTVAAMHVNADAMVHYGHSCFSKCEKPVFTVLMKQELDLEPLLLAIASGFIERLDSKLCFFYDTVFNHYKDEIKKSLFNVYPNCYVACINFRKTDNRVIGRTIEDKDGNHFPSGILKDCHCLYIGKKGATAFNCVISLPALQWHLLDPDVKQVQNMDETLWFKRRRYLVEKCRDAGTIGILVCLLSGVKTNDIIMRIKQICQKSHKKCYTISVGKPNVAKLANFPEIDIYVMIACPENDLFSSREFYKPIVYPFELEVALNVNRPQYNDTHVTDFEELLPEQKNYYELMDVEHYTDVSLITGRTRGIQLNAVEQGTLELVSSQNKALEKIGKNLTNRTWTGLEQNLGETEVKLAEEGRKGIPLKYTNETN